MASILNLDDIKPYLRVDFEEDDGTINMLIIGAEEYLRGSIDDFDIKVQNEKFKAKLKIPMLAIIKDCYDNKTLVTKDNEKIRTILNGFMLQLKYGSYE